MTLKVLFANDFFFFRLNDKIKEMQRHLVPVIEKVDVLLRR